MRTRAELIAAAERLIGKKIRKTQIDYALKMKFVRPSGRRPDGWFLYDERALDDLVKYMETRSRAPRRELIA